MDVEKYLNHIQLFHFQQLNGLELLNEIHRHHLLHVPFENLDMMNGIPLSMDAKHVFDKLVSHHRGGLCFELNSLLYAILKQLDFHVSYISGQFWDDNKQAWNPPFSHLALLVELDEQYLFDVGVGGGFLEPLPLKTKIIFSDASGTYRFVNANEHHSLILQKKDELDEWGNLLKISTEPAAHERFQPMLIALQKDKDSIFNQKKMCSKVTADGRISLTEDTLTLTKNGVKTKSAISDLSQWKELLEKHFGIIE